MQVNTANFIRWDDQNEDPGLPDVPFAYWRDRFHCGYMPIFSPGEAHSFYVNSKTGFRFFVAEAEIDTNALRLALIRAENGDIVTQNLPVAVHNIPKQNEADPQFYNPYSSFVVPAAEDGIYFMRIFDGNTGATLLTSNLVIVRNDRARLLETTTFCRFRHDRTYYNIRYHDIPGFYQEIRLGISQADNPQVDVQSEEYTEVTTGQTVVSESTERLYKKFESYYFDKEAHIAASVMIGHKFVELNGDRYTRKAAYKSQSNPLSKLSKGEFEMWDNAFSELNRC